MSVNVAMWLVLALVSQVVADGSAGSCPAVSRDVMTRAAAAVAGGDYEAASEQLRVAYDGVDGGAPCRDIRLAAWASRGWRAVAQAAARGGSAVDRAPLIEAIGAVTAIGPARSDAAYAAALLRAASAAAQDERDEMQVWLDEARALSVRLALLGPAPVWPLPIELAEGELWHEVDDYELAEAAFGRALAAAPSVTAWRGLARARDRRGNRAGACAAYREVQALLRAVAPAGPANEARGYLLLCRP